MLSKSIHSSSVRSLVRDGRGGAARRRPERSVLAADDPQICTATDLPLERAQQLGEQAHFLIGRVSRALSREVARVGDAMTVAGSNPGAGRVPITACAPPRDSRRSRQGRELARQIIFVRRATVA